MYCICHSVALSADRWPDDVRLSDLEPRFVCKACGKGGADVRPDFNWRKPPAAAMGYRNTAIKGPGPGLTGWGPFAGRS